MSLTACVPKEESFGQKNVYHTRIAKVQESKFLKNEPVLCTKIVCFVGPLVGPTHFSFLRC